MKSYLRYAVFLFMPATIVAQSISGTVRNGTTGQPSSGDQVIVMPLRDGMEQESQSITDSRGGFSVALKSPSSAHLLRVIHAGVNYDQAIKDSSPLSVTVFDSALRVADVHGRLGMAQVEAEGNRLKVTEMYSIVNPSSPPVTQTGPRNFEFKVPVEAKIEFLQVRRPQSVWVNVNSTASKSEPGKYAVDFPIRPGDTLFKFVYYLPYSGSAKLQFRPAYPVETFAVAHPPQMHFKAAKAAFTKLGTAQGLSMEQVAAKGMLREIPAFQVSGMGAVAQPQVSADKGFAPEISAKPAQASAAVTTAAPSTRDVRALLVAFAALLSAAVFGFWRNRRRHAQVIPVLALVILLSLAGRAQEPASEPSQAPAQNTAPVQQSGDFAIENPQATKVPRDVILVKGAVPGSSDPSVPVPESGGIAESVYTNKYFGFSWPLPNGWLQKYSGPPPSDSGYYVLGLLEPGKALRNAASGNILISAQDLFFPLAPVNSALSLVTFNAKRLSTDFKIEQVPQELKIGKRKFVQMGYMSPVAELHWYTLATEIRCHVIEFQFTTPDTELLKTLAQSVATMADLEEQKSGPVCVKNYATGNNLLLHVDPVFSANKFNPIPVRIVIDKYGKIKHVHVLSAFPDQIKAVNEALQQWEFRPYKVNGEPMEVETGIMFGGPHPQQKKGSVAAARVAD
jgi:hypothetical protein